MFDRQNIERAGLEAVVRQMPAGAIVVEAVSEEIILANDQARRLVEQNLGCSMPKDLSGLDRFRMFHPDGRPCLLEELPLTRSVRTGEEVAGEEYFYTLADEGLLWLRIESSPIYDEAGERIAAVLLAHDITQGKRHEMEQRRLASVVEWSSDFIGIADLDWRATYLNEAGQRRVGLEGLEEVRHTGVLDYIAPEDWPYIRETIVPAVMERGYWTGEFRFRHFQTGALIDVLWNLMRIDDPRTGEPLNLASVAHDITERKCYEEEIRTHARQQAAIADLSRRALESPCLDSLMDEAVAVVARNLEVEYATVLESLHSTRELLVRAGVGLREGLVGSTEEAALDPQAKYTLEDQEPVIVEDAATQTHVGMSAALRERGAVSAVTVVIPGRDAPFGVLGAYARSRRHFSEDDVNFLQAVANVLAAAIERKVSAEQLVEVREAERNRIARDLHDEALRDLTQALAEAQYLQHISEDPEELAHRQSRLVTALGRAGQQLRAAIYDLRLEDTRDEPLPRLLEALVEHHRALNPACETRLEVGEGAAALRDSFDDTGREMLRIIAEALTNARRHSGAYNVTVAVETAEEKLWAEVRDDGRGFDTSRQGSTTVSATGGMGMKAMRERAHAVGASLQIESRRGEGTTVRLEFALDIEPQSREVETDENEPGEEMVRVLLVEDHATVREAIAASLQRESGFEIVGQAGSMAEARRTLETRPVNVAIIDLGLPDGYGGDLIKELRQSHPDCQALVLSANLGREEVARAVEAGAGGVLHKTSHLDEVADAVRRLRAGETLMDPAELVELLRFASTEREQAHQALRAIERLTVREREVLQALAEGLDSEGIAERLHISVRTQRNHMANIFSKLGVHSQLQALVFALRHGVVDIR